MSEQIQRVVECSQRLIDLRHQLDEVEAQRNALNGEIDRCVAQLATLTGGQLVPPPNSSPSGRVILLLRRDPHPMAPSEVAQALGVTERTEVRALRGLMSRLARQGRLRKVGHGRYLALDSE